MPEGGACEAREPAPGPCCPCVRQESGHLCTPVSLPTRGRSSRPEVPRAPWGPLRAEQSPARPGTRRASSALVLVVTTMKAILVAAQHTGLAKLGRVQGACARCCV